MYDHANQLKSVAPDRPSTEIEGCMTKVNNALERLSSRIDSIDDRLRPVMRVTGSSALSGNTSVPQEALSPMGDAIRSIEHRVDYAVDRLEALLAGLAL